MQRTENPNVGGNVSGNGESRTSALSSTSNDDSSNQTFLDKHGKTVAILGGGALSVTIATLIYRKIMNQRKKQNYFAVKPEQSEKLEEAELAAPAA